MRLALELAEQKPQRIQRLKCKKSVANFCNRFLYLVINLNCMFYIIDAFNLVDLFIVKWYTLMDKVLTE